MAVRRLQRLGAMMCNVHSCHSFVREWAMAPEATVHNYAADMQAETQGMAAK